MPKLLAAFQDFFRQHAEHWQERFQYKEAGPQLLLQAFLQRILNGGGRIEREYGLGRLRTDLLIFWPYPDGVQQDVGRIKSGGHEGTHGLVADLAGRIPVAFLEGGCKVHVGTEGHEVDGELLAAPVIAHSGAVEEL